MQKYKSNITTTSGAAVRNAPVTVLKEDGALASLFLDRDGHVAAPNPLKTGPDGTFYFYAVNGRYSIRTTVEGVTITDDDVVLMMDPEEITVAGPIAEAVAAAQAAAIAAQFAVEASGIPDLVAAAQIAVVDSNNAVTQANSAANNAAISKTGADSARDAAVAAKNAAEAALDSFDDRYLGAKSVAPTTDNDGAELITGALYWDAALPGMRSWNGSVWVTLPAATKASVGLPNVDDTSDADKPISSAAQTALNGKANTSHTHAVADVTGLQSALNGKAAASHGHAIADVTGLQAALDGTVKTSGDQAVTGKKTFNTSAAIRNSAPTLFLRSNTDLSSMIHVASNYFYVLRGGVDSETWSMVNGQWPLTISLANNDALFGGNVTASGNVTAYSDIRIKTDITKITDALSKVSRLNGYTYTRKDTGQRQTGVVAQELQEVLPEAIVDTGEHLAVAYGNMVGLLIEAIKELKSEVDQLKGK